MTVPRTTGSSPQRSIVECVRPAWPTPVDTPQSDVNTMVTWPLAVGEVVGESVVTWHLLRWNGLSLPGSRRRHLCPQSGKRGTPRASSQTGR